MTTTDLHRSRLSAGVGHVIHGVSPVLEVPFLDDGRIDTVGFRRVVRYVLGTGVTSVMFPGFASEYYKLSEGEREELMGVLLAEANQHPGTTVIAAVQDHATLLAVDHARRLVARGAGAVNLLPPHLLSPSAAAIERHIRAVLKAIPDTPVVLQYAPNETGTSLDAGRLGAVAADHPNLVLVKVESSPPGPFISQLGALEPPLESMEGYAGVQLPDAVRRGAIGTQPGCSFTEIYQAIWALYESGDHAEADRLHARLLPYTSYWMLDTELIIAAEKLISYRRGLIGSPYCREPRRVLDDEELSRVDTFLAEFADLLPSLDSL